MHVMFGEIIFEEITTKEKVIRQRREEEVMWD
jgi:hypothetical protein